MSIQKAIKEKIPVFLKVALTVSVASIVIQGLIKLIWKVDWFDLEVNQRLADFFLFKNEIVQVIILQIFFMFNFVIVIAIANKDKIIDVIKSIWWLLILTYFLNFIPKEYAFFIVPFSGILINMFYCLKRKYNIKHALKTSALIILITIIMSMYQSLSLFIRFNKIPNVNEIFGFYEQFIFLIDMYLVAYFYYHFKKVR